MTRNRLLRISTGVSGLDEILHGGLIPERNYLVRGDPGTGKSILGMNYLAAGAEAGESVLFANLEESEDTIRKNAETLGIDLSAVEFLDLSPDSNVFTDQQSYDIFTPTEVEQEPLARTITEQVESIDPDRVFIDPITRLRHLTSSQYQFRRQVISLMHFLKEQGATVLFTSQNTQQSSDNDLQYLSDGSIELERTFANRTITVPKFRGSAIRRGNHTMCIEEGGIIVYPELSHDDRGREFVADPISSGLPQVDELLHGGFERGTISILSGPSGVGKTTLGTQFMKEAAGRGERSVIYLFEETEKTFRRRCHSIGIQVESMAREASLAIEAVEPLRLSALEFARKVRREVEENDTDIVMIDGIDGYRLSLRGESSDLTRRLHSLCRSLKDMGVTVILVDQTSTVAGEFSATDAGVSYLADNIVFLQYVETLGRMRKAIGVLKKRTSDFERTLREFHITEQGIRVGEPITGLHGVLNGSLQLADNPEQIPSHDD
ncbi:ATPase domain-containing protein [Haladaptatus cibarius]|uniref:ATPase domain-containing protein n=1 Tax=Haladaptatus cibarius TaxID=453847 RepID=UPI0006793572